MNIETIIANQRAYFQTGITKSFSFRLNALKRLKVAIQNNESKINEALKIDLNKSSFESYMTEVGMTLGELSYVIKHLRSWVKTEKVVSPLAQFHSKSFVVTEPYGVTLVMSPWNFPLLLCLEPLVGAIAAGNCCVLKPSAYSPATSALIFDLIKETFIPEYVTVIEGGREANSTLLEQRFDYIFFTGGVTVGKIVMEKASKNLTPVTLELGGKSPCIVDETANLNLAAKRLVFGKYLNGGQTCVAPDYLLIQASVKEEFLQYVSKWIVQMFGEKPLENPDYPKMINKKHYDRVMNLIKGEDILVGGKGNEDTLRIVPTVLHNITGDSPIMQEEIFGPVLPVLTFHTIEEAESFVQLREKPLALYLFTTDRQVEKRILNNVSFGGGCINDTIIHIATSRMGFGGVGGSGMGSYHGRLSFETFSHKKSIVKKYNWIDLAIRYQPYNETKSKFIRMFLK